MTIQPIEQKDLKAVIKIIGDHYTEDGKSAHKYFKGYLSDPQRLKSSREQNFISLNNKGEITGVCGFSPDKYDTPKILWLTWFYVAKGYQKKGIGTQLLTYTLNQIKSIKNIKKVYLDTSSHPDYAASVNLYKKFGFQIEANLTNYWGRGDNALILGLDVK
jgi:ribosomal protein S18 acetylase RimI-like enzyme